MANYIGITIGPIGDTMNITSSPAGLWAASYLFSYLAHRIRSNIGKEGLLQDDLTPDLGSLFEKGVGLYHDRIIYEADETYTLENAVLAVKNSVEEIVEGFLKSISFREEEEWVRTFFYSYFNIHVLSVDVASEENFLIAVNDALDAAELEKNFPATIKYNPILWLFDGSEKGKNEEIKESFLVSGNDINRKKNWVLTDDSEQKIKDLPKIAASVKETYNGADDKPKPSRYYAVVRADGDNMGKTIKEEIHTEPDYIEFSKKCFLYGCNTAKIVLKYGGIPIYVGGDDLLCIVPLMCRFDEDAHTFLEMIKEIRDGFKDPAVFPGAPDLSFGVQIQYVKAPLYEAMSESSRLLFGTAKPNKPGAIAINLKKHSGQSAEILVKEIGNADNGGAILNKVDELIKKHFSEKTLKSVGQHVADFSVLLNQAAAIGEKAINNFFDNIFDNEISDTDRGYLGKISELAIVLNNNKGENDSLADILGAYIRIIKFFSEKVDKQEE